MRDHSVLQSARRLWRSRVGLRLVLAVSLSIAVVEGAVLIPSYRNYERDLVGRPEHAGCEDVNDAGRLSVGPAKEAILDR